MPRCGLPFARMANACQIRQPKVQRTALQKVQLCLDVFRADSVGKRQHRSISLFQKHVGHLGEAIKADLIFQFVYPLPVDHGTRPPVSPQGKDPVMVGVNAWYTNGGKAGRILGFIKP